MSNEASANEASDTEPKDEESADNANDQEANPNENNETDSKDDKAKEVSDKKKLPFFVPKDMDVYFRMNQFGLQCSFPKLDPRTTLAEVFEMVRKRLKADLMIWASLATADTSKQDENLEIYKLRMKTNIVSIYILRISVEG